jgi:PTH1 family peptidyl-tRNA hydrolase
MTERRFLVVGLGNPGQRYAATRHNAGQLVLDVLADRVGGRFAAHKGSADVCHARLSDVSVLLLKPMSFMNVSGGPVAAVSRYFKIDIADIVVVHDELDLPFGMLRLKRGGGEGGHNGLRSTTASLGSKEYTRVRVGIGRPPGRQDPADYVLREFTVAERRELPLLLDRAADAVQAVVSIGLPAAQNTFNA